MNRYVPCIVLIFCCAIATGSSIFDDDYVAPKEAPPSKTDKPEARPAPTQRPSDDQPPPRPQPQPDPQPDNAQPGNVVQPPADAPVPAAGIQHSGDALQDALDQAQKAFNDANKALENKLGQDSAYVAARERAKAAGDKGDAESSAAILLKRLHDAAADKTPEYKKAKRYYTFITRLNNATPQWRRPYNKPIPTAEDYETKITDAVAGHDLIEGMTFQEACKSARKQFTLMKKSGDEKIYHWILKGSTGTVRETHRDFHGNIRIEDVPTYGVIGYVEGVFDDDYLISFKRGR